MVQPESLKKGDSIALIATARKLKIKEILPAIKIIGDWGLKICIGKNIFKTYHQFAGTDEQRAEDLQWAMDNPEIKAILCARGGYGTMRIMDSVNFHLFRKNPKWIIGFSDITALLFHINKLGIESIHAPTGSTLSKKTSSKSIESLKNILFGNPVRYKIKSLKSNRTGFGKGEIIGGNLTLIHNLISTKSDQSFANKILFIEDVDEYLYHIDRMMIHFKRSGKLKNLSGLIVGHFTKMNDNRIPFGKTAYQIISEVVSEYNYPVCFGFPVGHDKKNLPMICGRKATLSVNSLFSELIYEK